ncbi:uncharacterized protein LY79DRAFT_668980 [Colletotrichum navitas]|uniref:Major facilitator superfamily transporter n=1 Tax=Colletotrichum navitas TaxID=681940 RepID=A0AAD8Q1I3_9PEZI|nr:uncharacterized protein LY79DRAFT_668980 [Colletotrichum navitas]KAK1593743.1 hypothetical protein LY79DRAFT_668980 [Colletotrichum navitas]
MAFRVGVTAAVTNNFEPIIISGLGYDNSKKTALLNIPFGFVQLMVIFPPSYLAHQFRIKSASLAVILAPLLAVAVMLYVLGRNYVSLLLTAYHMLTFVFGGNPLVVSWIISNIAGTTKKSAIMSLFNAGSSAGNIVGPLLFCTKDAPEYKPGLTKVMNIARALLAITAL